MNKGLSQYIRIEEYTAHKLINPLYTGAQYHSYMFDESICHFRDVESILLLLFYFWWKIMLANNVGPDQTPHVASDLGLHCLPMTFLRVSRYKWDNQVYFIKDRLS